MGRIAFISLVALLIACSHDDGAGGMRLAIQKFDPLNGCWAPVWTELEQNLPFELGACTVGADTSFVAGSDSVRVVMDYGDDVNFEPGMAIPEPSLSVVIAGQEVSVNADIQRQPLASRGVFFGRFAVPAEPLGPMSIVARATQGFEREADEEFVVLAPQLDVVIRDCDPATGCKRFGGVDQALIELSAPGGAPQTATLSWTLDGVLSTQNVILERSHSDSLGPISQKVVSVPVPAAPPNTSWVIEGRLGPSVDQAAVITIDSAPLAISVDGCAAETLCEKTANTGTAVVHATGLGGPEQSVTLSTTIDGVVQPGTRTIVLSEPATLQGRAAATGFDHVPIPAAAEGARWQLAGRLGFAAGRSQEIVLHSPVIALEATCGSNCTLRAGSSVTVRVTAPIESLTKQAALSTSVNGVIGLAGATINLSVVDRNNQIISGTQNLPVPDVPGATWALDASVGGYSAPTLVLQLEP